MHKNFFIFICFLSFLHLNAQEITNMMVAQESDKVVITYDIIGNKTGQTFDIKVECSADNGKTFSITPQSLTGDLRGITAGTTKRIVWDVLSERQELAGDQFVFRLVAIVKSEREYAVFHRGKYGMVFVEGGTFQMGSDEDEPDEKPAHKVTLSSFYISKYEVTQALWQEMMGSNPSNFMGSNLPVEMVSWNDIQSFITKLNNQTGLNFRLPTEAEWEFAARGGASRSSATYAGSDKIDDVAWYPGNSDNKTHQVGQKFPNELGLYDMTGNVWEWCADWYGAYNNTAQTNPYGPSTGTYRVIRGGCWSGMVRGWRITDRSTASPTRTGYVVGFRLACSF